MATYVLVPGAWLGGWAWQDVAARLRARGHDVYPVTLTGLGERVHLARPDVDLETHITDVVNTIVYNNLAEVILAGHSYAGSVVTGVADRIPERLAQLLYVDSAPFPNGAAMTDFFPPEALAGMQQVVEAFGDGWRLPFPGVEALGENASLRGVSDEQRLVLETYAEPQPWASYTQPLRLERDEEPSFRRVVIACDDIRSMVEAGYDQIVHLTAAPWHYVELDTGHWPMFSTPAELTALLDDLANA